MKKKILIIFLSIFHTISSISKNNNASLLEIAYQNNSVIELDQFCQKWYSDLIKSNNGLNSSDSKEIYLIKRLITKFYQYKKPEIHTPFQTIQNKYVFVFCDSTQLNRLSKSTTGINYLKKDSLSNYIPHNESNIYIYLNKKYENILNDYFYQQNTYFNKNKTLKRYRKDYKNRASFLQNRIYTYPCHWGYPWCYISCYHIDKIYVSEDLKKSKIEYSISDFGGGIIEIQITNNELIIVNDKTTWLQ